MVFTHRIANDTRALSERLVVLDAELIHVLQSTALYRLYTVPHVRKCSGNDDAHRIINIRFLHDLRIFGPYNLIF